MKPDAWNGSRQRDARSMEGSSLTEFIATACRAKRRVSNLLARRFKGNGRYHT